jgi:hypothetical protein
MAAPDVRLCRHGLWSERSFAGGVAPWLPTLGPGRQASLFDNRVLPLHGRLPEFVTSTVAPIPWIAHPAYCPYHPGILGFVA